MGMDTIDMLGLLSIVINYLALFPFIIYLLRKFHLQSQNRKNRILQIRDKKLMFMINVVQLLVLLIDRPLQIFHRIWIILDPSTIWISAVFSVVTVGQLLILLTIKIYHLYFEHQCSVYIADLSWRKDINPNDTNWYIAHRNTWGNPIYLYKLCLIVIALLVMTETIQEFTIGEGPLFVSIHAMQIATCLVSAAICYFKIGSFEDVYCVKREVLYQLIFSVGGVVSYIAVNVLFSVVWPQNVRLKWLCVVWCVSYLLCLPMALFSTIYPLYLSIQHKKQRANDRKKHKYKICPSTSESNEPSYVNAVEQLITMISDYKWFKLFMQYLISQFCTENLLFVVEYYQMKLALQTKLGGIVHVPQANVIDTPPRDGDAYIEIDFNALPHIDANGKSIPYVVLCCGTVDRYESDIGLASTKASSIVTVKLVLPSELPQSSIVEKHDTFMDQIKHLHQKYIQEGSDFELNISHDNRTKLSNFMECIDAMPHDRHSSLYSLFDECCIEILFLLDDPFHRFVSGNECVKSLTSLCPSMRPES